MTHRYTPAQKAATKARLGARKQAFVGQLGGKCVECGSAERLEFDHIDPKQKSFTISTCLGYRIERLAEEIKKCQLLCETCHDRKTTADRGMNHAVHGSAAMYVGKRCRCDLCRKAWREYKSNLTRRDDLEHATRAMYGAGCRCYACMEYMAHINKIKREKRQQLRVKT